MQETSVQRSGVQETSVQETGDVIAPTRSWTRHRAAIVAAYLVLALALALAWGSLDRPTALLFLVGLAISTCAGSERRIPRFVMDWLPLLVIATGYDLVRSQTPDLLERAVVAPQLRFDEIVFGGTVPTVRLQRWLIDRGSPHWWDYLAFLIYLSHFVFTIMVAVVLYLRARARFHRFAPMILTLCIAGFVTYLLIPATPPWLASRQGDLQHTTRIVHSVWADLGVANVAEVFSGDARFANPVAALPSLHAAWPFLALLFLWPIMGRRGRCVLVGYNAAMVLTLVYGAEHYVSDILLGWLYAGVTFVLVQRVLDARELRKRSVSSN